MNKITFDGRLTRDSEIKYLPSGKSVLAFSVASDVGFGENKTTNFFNCNKWGDKLDKLAQFMIKGTQVTVYGTLTLREYQAKDGTNKSTLDVRVDDLSMHGSKQVVQSAEQQQSDYNNIPKPKREFADNKPSSDIDDDIPFN